jgi:putative oxidoreductase
MAMTLSHTPRVPLLAALPRLLDIGLDVARKLELALWPLVALALRLWIARVFFNSGLTKVRDWESTVLLFQFEYQVPLLPPSLAAALGTTFELGMPVLLVLGLATRLAALPLLGMALVIQFVLGAANPAYDSVEHYCWMLILLTLIARGGGALSLDALVKRLFARGS